MRALTAREAIGLTLSAALWAVACAFQRVGLRRAADAIGAICKRLDKWADGGTITTDDEKEE